MDFLSGFILGYFVKEIFAMAKKAGLGEKDYTLPILLVTGAESPEYPVFDSDIC